MPTGMANFSRNLAWSGIRLHRHPALQIFLFHHEPANGMDALPNQFKPFGRISVMGVMMEYATKKIPKSLVGSIARLKARMSLDGGRNVTEGEVIALAIRRLEEDFSRQSRIPFIKLVGTVRGKAKSNAE